MPGVGVGQVTCHRPYALVSIQGWGYDVTATDLVHMLMGTKCQKSLRVCADSCARDLDPTCFCNRFAASVADSGTPPGPL